VSSRLLLAFLAVFSISILGTLGLRPLYKADESRYAEIPREMVASGDWVTPRLNGLKYFEKPPLQYWATAASFSVFGEHDWAARLWSALAAIGGIFLVFASGRKLFSVEAGALGALVLAGCPLYVLLAQINTLDMALSFFLGAAILAFALGRYYLFWAACALAVLSKGLIGIVLPAGAIGLYILVKWDWSLLKKMRIPTGLLLFLAICAPWFILVSMRNAEFAHFFFIQEHFQRFTTKMHGRYQPMWFFVPILLAGLAPWLLPFFASLKNLFKRQQGFDPALLLALWCIVVFVFFSISGSKLPSYILPMFPAPALLIGRWLAASEPRRILVFQASLAVLAGIAAEAFISRMSIGIDYFFWVSTAVSILVIFSVCALIAAYKNKTTLAIALIAGGSFATTLTALVSHRVLAPAYSFESQAGAVPAGARVFAVDFYDHTIPWYLRRTVTMVSYKDELDVAITWEPHKFIPDLAGFARAWAETPGAYAVFSSSRFDELKKQIDLPMETVSRGPRYTLVRKP